MVRVNMTVTDQTQCRDHTDPVSSEIYDPCKIWVIIP